MRRVNPRAFTHRAQIHPRTQTTDSDGGVVYDWTTAARTGVPCMIAVDTADAIARALQPLMAIQTEISFAADPALSIGDQIRATINGVAHVWTVKSVVDEHQLGRFVTAKCEETPPIR